MKSYLTNFLTPTLCLVALCFLVPTALYAQYEDGGRDFLVTFMQTDGDSFESLGLEFNAAQPTTVTVENPYTGYSNTVQVLGTIGIYDLLREDCYVSENESEKVSNRALRIASTEPLSVTAINYRHKCNDATSLIPVQSLGSEYMIQCYTPSSQDGSNPYGSHFAIIATEDNTVVDYCLSVPSAAIKKAKEKYDFSGGGGMSEEEIRLANYQPGDTLSTPVLQYGQVYYISTGAGSGNDYDLSGSWVCAREGKRIAVFEGNPMTNIPHQVRDRDHLYSQAIPVRYWGTKYALTSSLTTVEGKDGYWERLDKVRIIALEDGTVVKVNGEIIHVFDFVNGDADDQKHFFEFEIGVKDEMSNWQQDPARPDIKRIESTNCYVETSAPCTVHQFTASNRYDHDKVNGGKYCQSDGSMMTVMPIECMSRDIYFNTFTATDYFAYIVNIVTPSDNIHSVFLDGNSIADQFHPFQGNASLQFARINVAAGTHSLTSSEGLLANLYGCGEKQAYSYALGVPNFPIPYIFINDDRFDLSRTNAIEYCSKDELVLNCKTSFEFKSIKMEYGDGSVDSFTNDTMASFVHTYQPGLYLANLIVEQEYASFGMEREIDTIQMRIWVEPFDVTYEDLDDIYVDGDEKSFKIYYHSPISLYDDVHMHFNDRADQDGFRDYEMRITEEYIEIPIPERAQPYVPYELIIEVYTPCEKWTTTIPFELKLYPRYTVTYLCDPEQGYILGETTVRKNDTISFRAYPYYGYHFVKWSDGITENPRECMITQDTTFTALFGIDKSGTCGDDNALTWSYDDASKTLTIGGNGRLTYNYSYGVEAPKYMRNLIIGNGVTEIGNSAFYGMTTINHLTIGGNVTYIGDYAFSECRNFDDITCIATDVPAITEYTFANVGNKKYIYLYVPEERQRAYLRDEYWSEFDVQLIGASPVTTSGVTVDPAETTVEITWPSISGAATYELVIKDKDGNIICTLIFNSDGILTSIAFKAPSRSDAPQQLQSAGFAFIVTGLEEETEYQLTIIAKNSKGVVLYKKEKNFRTYGGTAIDNVQSAVTPSAKLLRDGQLLILRDGHTYTITGQELK